MSLDLINKLNIKSQSFLPSQGHSIYDMDDVIDAIAHLPPLATMYIYALNESSSNVGQIKRYTTQLQSYFANLLYQQIVSDELECRKLSQLALAQGIARASVHAHFNARGQCKACNGNGVVFKDGGKKCGDCFGKGVRQINDVEKSRLAFPDVKFDRSWWGKYARKYETIVQDELNELLNTVDQAIDDMKKRVHKTVKGAK